MKDAEEKKRNGKDSFRLELCMVLCLQMLKEGKRYGYELMQEINSLFTDVVAFRSGTIYPVIYRMEDEGFVTADKISMIGTRRKERVYYSITDKGLEEYQRLSKKYIAIADIIKDRLEMEESLENIR